MLLNSANDHDTREKILISMLGMSNACKKELNENLKLIEILKNLDNEYKSLISGESKTGDEDDGYYKKIEEIITQLIKAFGSDRKTEL